MSKREPKQLQLVVNVQISDAVFDARQARSVHSGSILAPTHPQGSRTILHDREGDANLGGASTVSGGTTANETLACDDSVHPTSILQTDTELDRNHPSVSTTTSCQSMNNQVGHNNDSESAALKSAHTQTAELSRCNYVQSKASKQDDDTVSLYDNEFAADADPATNATHQRRQNVCLVAEPSTRGVVGPSMSGHHLWKSRSVDDHRTFPLVGSSAAYDRYEPELHLRHHGEETNPVGLQLRQVDILSRSLQPHQGTRSLMTTSRCDQSQNHSNRKHPNLTAQSNCRTSSAGRFMSVQHVDRVARGGCDCNTVNNTEQLPLTTRGQRKYTSLPQLSSSFEKTRARDGYEDEGFLSFLRKGFSRFVRKGLLWRQRQRGREFSQSMDDVSRCHCRHGQQQLSAFSGNSSAPISPVVHSTDYHDGYYCSGNVNGRRQSDWWMIGQGASQHTNSHQEQPEAPCRSFTAFACLLESIPEQETTALGGGRSVAVATATRSIYVNDADSIDWHERNAGNQLSQRNAASTQLDQRNGSNQLAFDRAPASIGQECGVQFMTCQPQNMEFHRDEAFHVDLQPRIDAKPSLVIQKPTSRHTLSGAKHTS